MKECLNCVVLSKGRVGVLYFIYFLFLSEGPQIYFSDSGEAVDPFSYRAFLFFFFSNFSSERFNSVSSIDQQLETAFEKCLLWNYHKFKKLLLTVKKQKALQIFLFASSYVLVTCTHRGAASFWIVRAQNGL